MMLFMVREHQDLENLFKKINLSFGLKVISKFSNIK